MAITTKVVTSRQDLRRFVRFPNELYADNKYYVPQIESMDMDTLTPGKNRAFEVCEGKYWLAYDENGKSSDESPGSSTTSTIRKSIREYAVSDG